MVAIRLLVSNTQLALDFYHGLLGFEIIEQWGPAFAIIERDGVTVWVSGPGTSAQQELADGQQPEPGGWNRLVLAVASLSETLAVLAEKGYFPLVDPVKGPGGTQALVSDGVGNVVEIFEENA